MSNDCTELQLVMVLTSGVIFWNLRGLFGSRGQLSVGQD